MLFSATDSVALSGQFSFKPTGKKLTTCSSTFLMHYVTRLLEEHTRVRCLFIDFSKAFDVGHHDSFLS